MRLLIVDDEIFAIEGIKAGVNWDVLDFSEVLTANSYAQAVEIMDYHEHSIGAGANDLLRDGIAEAGLGLPRAVRR